MVDGGNDGFAGTLRRIFTNSLNRSGNTGRDAFVTFIRKKETSVKTLRTTVISITSVIASIALVAPAASAATSGTSTSVVPSSIKVGRKHVVETDRVIAKALRISTKQLRSELDAGATLAQVASNHGSSAARITAVVSASIKKTVSAAVKSGVVSRRIAASKMKSIQASFASMLNRAVASSKHGDIGPVDLMSEKIVADLLGVSVDGLKAELKSGISIATAATNHGVAIEALTAALSNDATAKINAAVVAGTITQTKADEMIAALPAKIETYINRSEPRRDGGRGERGPKKKELVLVSEKVAAEAIGITEDALEKELEKGQSIAMVAIANGKTAQEVMDALSSDATTRINAAVADGTLTQTQADAYLAALSTLVSDFVNRVHEVETPKLPEDGVVVVSFATAASTIGISESALRSELKTGITIAQSAINHGVTVDALTSALTSDAQTRIADALAAGTITQEKADAYTANLSAAIAAFINKVVGRRH